MTLEHVKQLIEDPKISNRELLVPLAELVRERNGSYEKALDHLKGRRDGFHQVLVEAKQTIAAAHPKIPKTLE